MEDHLKTNETNGWQRVTEDNEHERCMSGRGPGGQCPYVRVKGSDYCPRHGGNKALESQRIDQRNKYLLGKYQARYRDFAEDSGIKSLREEIGVLRMLLEEVFKRCQPDDDDDKMTLMLYLPKIESLVEKIRKTVESCDRIETKIGMTLDRNQVMNIGTILVQVIGKHIDDPDILETIGEEILGAIAGPVTNAETR